MVIRNWMTNCLRNCGAGRSQYNKTFLTEGIKKMITTPKIDEEAFMRSTILYDTSSRLVHPLPLPSCQPDSSGPLRTLHSCHSLSAIKPRASSIDEHFHR